MNNRAKYIVRSLARLRERVGERARFALPVSIL